MGNGCIGELERFQSPWLHVESSQFLASDIADEIAAGWPTQGGGFVRHSDILRDDGTSLRRYWLLRDVFPRIAGLLLTDVEEPLRTAVAFAGGKLYPQALLVEDAPGYRIRRHTDCAGKMITCQVYLAEDDQHPDQGVVLQDELGRESRQVPYLFNYGYAFKVTKASWHRVARAATRRRSLQVIYYSMPDPAI